MAVRKYVIGGIITLAGVILESAYVLGYRLPIGEIVLPLAIIALGVTLLVSRR